MNSQIRISDPGLISIGELIYKVLPKYDVDLNELGIPFPSNRGVVQQYCWHFIIDRTLDVVASYFNNERAIDVLVDIGKPTLKQFELQKDSRLAVGAQGLYWIKKKFTLAKGQFVITNNSLNSDVLRLGYVRLEDLRKNWALLGMLDRSGFGFSVFEFSQASDEKTQGSYYIAQQLPGHMWSKPLTGLLRKKLKNPSFSQAFTALKQTIESS